MKFTTNTQSKAPVKFIPFDLVISFESKEEYSLFLNMLDSVDSHEAENDMSNDIAWNADKIYKAHNK